MTRTTSTSLTLTSIVSGGGIRSDPFLTAFDLCVSSDCCFVLPAAAFPYFDDLRPTDQMLVLTSKS